MNYRIGDRVLVREWEAMKRGKEVTDGGSISEPRGYAFSKDMRKFCGQRVTIGEIMKGCYRIKEDQYGIWSDSMFAHNFEYGEEIEIRDGKRDDWDIRIFVGYIDGAPCPFYATNRREFELRKKFSIAYWYLARKIRQPQIEITCNVNGEEVPLNTISDQTLLNIRRGGI